MSEKINIDNGSGGFFIAIVLALIFFYGEPDLHESLIEKLGEKSCEIVEKWNATEQKHHSKLYSMLGGGTTIRIWAANE